VIVRYGKDTHYIPTVESKPVDSDKLPVLARIDAN